eukprot:GHVT01066398.1.p1 GENE.GHVT01066398.1~~GHVT01066398.1.p1  ORF type:complete len:124 (+),score=27.59 GHVT01066398.1:610-981(+)
MVIPNSSRTRPRLWRCMHTLFHVFVSFFFFISLFFLFFFFFSSSWSSSSKWPVVSLRQGEGVPWTTAAVRVRFPPPFLRAVPKRLRCAAGPRRYCAPKCKGPESQRPGRQAAAATLIFRRCNF